MRRIFVAAFTVAALAIPTLASALSPPVISDLSGTRSLGMGNAFRSVASSNEALYFNPAGVALGRRYEIDGMYGVSPGDRLRLLNVSVVDSKTAGLAAGIGYTHLSGEGGPADTNGSLVHLGLGIPLAGKVAGGVGFKYLGFSSPESTSAITADVGLLIQPFRFFTVGLVAYNVIDVSSEQAPLRAGGGISIGSDSSFRLAVDAAFALDQDDPVGTTYHAGGEYFFDGVLPIRLGFERREGEDRNFVTAGMGLVSHLAGIEAAFAQGLGEGKGEERIFSFTLKLFL